MWKHNSEHLLKRLKNNDHWHFDGNCAKSQDTFTKKDICLTYWYSLARSEIQQKTPRTPPGQSDCTGHRLDGCRIFRQDIHQWNRWGLCWRTCGLITDVESVLSPRGFSSFFESTLHLWPCNKFWFLIFSTSITTRCSQIYCWVESKRFLFMVDNTPG